MNKILFFLSIMSLASCRESNSDAASNPDVLFVNGFETLDGWLPEQQSSTLTHEQAHSGHTSLKVDEAHEYSLSYSNLLGHLHSTPIRKIKVSAWAFLPSAQAAATLVTAVADPTTLTNKPLMWEGLELNKVVTTYNQWVEVSKVMSLPTTISPGYKLNLYLWRTSGNQPVYIDDLKVAIEP